MEDFKDRALSKLAKGVADERHDQAESKATEAGYLQSAQTRMKGLNVLVFSDHGVEFVRVPGDEKFRVRLTKSEANRDATADEGDAHPSPEWGEHDERGPDEAVE